jgi:hypothetical protein
VRAVVSLAALAAACGISRPDYPQVLNEDEGPVLASPVVVPIFFGDDPHMLRIEDFLGRLGPSEYWFTTTHEYGVGPIRVAPAVVMTDAPPKIDFNEVRSWLQDNLDGPGWPPATAETVFTIFFPATSLATSGCFEFHGYHQEIPRPGDFSIIYAVILRCPPENGLSELDRVTSVLSHELIEASTDPLVQTQRAFSGVDFQHLDWARLAGGGELTDLCKLEGDGQVARLVGPYAVQRSWSNMVAATGSNPCVP